MKTTSHIFVRTPFNYDRNKASKASGLSCLDPSRTDQSFREECDINTIVRNFGVTGQLPDDVRTPLEGDFTEVVDYQTAVNLVLESNRAFAQMPSDVRERFNNDPGKFVAFASDPANLDECRKMGLANPLKQPPTPISVRIHTDPSDGPKEPAKESKNAPAPKEG